MVHEEANLFTRQNESKTADFRHDPEKVKLRPFSPPTSLLLLLQKSTAPDLCYQYPPAAGMSLQDARLFHWHYDELDDRNFRVKGHELLFLFPVLAVLLFFALLCFCLRRACRRAGSEASTAEGGGQGMDVEAVRRLPVRAHRGEAAVCSICLGVVADGEKERPLPVCGHWFHPECIEEWLRKQSNCPLCRAMIVGGGSEETSPPPPPPVQVIGVTQ